MDATLEDLRPVYETPELDQSDARIPPPNHHSTSPPPDDQAYHRTRTHYQHGQPIQINNPNMNAAPQSPGPSIGDTMQMMMMNQMMTQQMTAQQMQAAQMNMLMQQAGGRGRGSLREKKAGVKIRSRSLVGRSDQAGRQVRRRQPRPVQVTPPQRVQPPQGELRDRATLIAVAPALGGVESAAMANWQEATIILCIAIVGLIYLVSSRSTAKEDDEKSAVARHLTTKAR